MSTVTTVLTCFFYDVMVCFWSCTHVVRSIRVRVIGRLRVDGLSSYVNWVIRVI